MPAVEPTGPPLADGPREPMDNREPEEAWKAWTREGAHLAQQGLELLYDCIAVVAVAALIVAPPASLTWAMSAGRPANAHAEGIAIVSNIFGRSDALNACARPIPHNFLI